MSALRRLIPSPLLSLYHLALAYWGAWRYGFSSRELIVIGVTGTKGKSSTSEMMNAILEAAGHKTALLNSIRIKVGERSEPNLLRMSMPGRAFIQKFLREAQSAGCTAAVLEMTSQGATQNRHRSIDLDGLLFLNLAPEHIESHGGYEAYADAKFELGKQLVRSSKRPRIMVANIDDEQSVRYLELPVEKKIGFSLRDHQPLHFDERSGFFSFDGTRIDVPQPGEFSLKNAVAASEMARALDIKTEAIARGLANVSVIPGRAERIEAGQDFTVIVDYAHTPDSLRALYETYKGSRIIGVLGSMGGGRDAWKHPVTGQIADEYCDVAILTEEDPYDDDPETLIANTAKGFSRHTPRIEPKRRDAIRAAIKEARTGDVVLITGKGSNHEIMGPKGTIIPWSDAEVAREELEKHLRSSGV